ncbi:hypothetical protein EYR41_004488 [Orbilia oligospora]|uniref:Uncharacterized protein n=1 Tax=Orbilia oligospora TaxID=2813651 RepID=A0A7C8KKI2_ORBOL|nr:hypothetical protein TWF751_009791 [Orbilia oligospora]TGJ72605.1 hypothetical protein EYR41_004488 [Orbilia oligospora]
MSGGLEEGRYGTPVPYNTQHGFNPAGVSEMPSAYNAQSDYYSGQYNRAPEMSYAYGANGGNALYPDPNPPLHTMPPPQFQDKPPPVAPVHYGATGAGAGAGAGAAMGMGAPPPEKRICGIRRKIFFIILAVVIVLIIAGLAAGLAIALTRKNNDSSRDRQADGAGAGTASSSSVVSTTTSGNQPAATSEDNTPFVPSIGPTETSDPITSESSTAEPTTTEAEETTTTEEASTEGPTTTPEPTTEDITTEEPTTTPEPTIVEETTSEDPFTTPEETITPRTSPEPSPTPPSDGLITPTFPPETTPRQTTPREPSTPTISAFALETGYNTLDLVVTSTTGNSDLCSLLIAAIPATTTIYPSIVGDAEDLYTAYWQLDNFPGTLTATGTPPEPTADFQIWSFEVPISNSNNGCVQEGGDSMVLEESGVAIYSSGFAFGSQCNVGGLDFTVGDFCYVYWAGTYSS